MSADACRGIHKSRSHRSELLGLNQLAHQLRLTALVQIPIAVNPSLRGPRKSSSLDHQAELISLVGPFRLKSA